MAATAPVTGRVPTAPASFPNPLRDPDLVVAPPDGDPLAFHRRLPGYRPTPLRRLPALAPVVGVREVLVKDEAERLGLPAFKMLGAAWACYRALVERLGRDPEPWSDLSELSVAIDALRPLTLATATDGNHGRALARFARLLGLPARIRVPAGTVEARIEAIRSEGAEVTVSSGGYDDAVREVAAAADERTLVVSDTSWEGYQDVPRRVIDGYSTIFAEIDQQLADEPDGLRPDVVVVPVGVGAFAAAVVARYRRAGAEPTTIVAVEPTTASCVASSALAGRLVTLNGPQDSIMAGLNCGTPSPVAWPLVSAGVDWFVTVDDDQARDAMRELAVHGVVSGESGAATLAGLVQLRRDTGLPAAEATVLLLSTEGATDPAAYREIVGTA